MLDFFMGSLFPIVVASVSHTTVAGGGYGCGDIL